MLYPSKLLGHMSILSRAVYILVGLSAIYVAANCSNGQMN
ncbi:MAG: DUF378 domain-containing protein [Methanothrix sp.]|nr:MAG: DUF378 domain-containing protein [Methanothrix sp.]